MKRRGFISLIGSVAAAMGVGTVLPRQWAEDAAKATEPIPIDDSTVLPLEPRGQYVVTNIGKHGNLKVRVQGAARHMEVEPGRTLRINT